MAGVGFDAAGNVIASGVFRGVTDFGNGATVMPTGTYDIYVARYDAGGS